MAQLTLSEPVSVEHVPGSSLIKLMAQLAQTSIVVLQGSANSYFVFANNVPVSEYIQDSYMTQTCHRIRCSMVFQSTRCTRTYRPGLVHLKLVRDILWLVSLT